MSEGSLAERLLGAIRSGNAPKHVREAAARGALPLDPHELTRLQVLLLEDPEESVRVDAERQLESLEDEALAGILARPECAGEVLSHFSGPASTRPRLAEPIVFHENTPFEAMAALCAKGKAGVLDLVLTNQERLLGDPRLLDLLTVNPALRNDQQGRILEMIDRVARLMPDREPAADATETDGDGPGEPTAEERAAAEEMARLLDLDVGELYAASEIVDGEEFETSEDPDVVSAYKKIVTMNAAQKSVMAMKGGREERMILIRDSNRIVALAVLKNSRISESEIEQIAAMRNVNVDVLRNIANVRDWVKHYSIVTQLVRNPRTPPGVSTNFIPRLQNKELKNLGRDRNVPELVRRMAKRTLETRLNRKPDRFKRK